MRAELPIISIDGVELREFDYIDIGALIPTVGRGAGGHQVAGLPAAPGAVS